MKQTNKIALFVLMFSLVGFAKPDNQTNLKERSELKQNGDQIDIFELPEPDSGVTVIPLAKMNIPKAVKHEELVNLTQQKIRGYYKSTTPDAKQLLSIKNQLIIKFEENDPYDTHMKEHLSDLKLAFPFPGIAIDNQKNIIGFAVMGTWVKSGWTGVAEFFIDEKLGTCEFSHNSISLTHGAAQIMAEWVRYDINEIPNTLSISGSDTTGFLYDIMWYNGNYRENLKCANMKYDPQITNGLISLAKKIDKDNLTNN